MTGIQPTYVALRSGAGVSASVRAGQVLQGAIQQSGDDLLLLVAGSRVALPSGSGLEHGQTVQVTVQESAAGLQFQVTPQASGGEAAPLADPLGRLMAAALELVAGIRDSGTAATLAPAALPASAEAARLIASLFVGQTLLGEDLQQLAAIVGQAVREDVLPGLEAEALQGQFARFESEALDTFLRGLVESGRTPAEARVAAALVSGNVAEAFGEEEDLRTRLTRLRDNEALRGFLRRTGGLKGFDRLVDRMLDRLVGGQLQNLRALEQPYCFIELPCSPESGVHHAQVHFLGDGQGGANRIDANHATVVMDLSMTRLGDLWITLRLAEGLCVCRIQARDPKAAEALMESRDELVGALRSAERRAIRVEIEPWRAGRLQEVATLMGRFKGIGVNA